MRLALGLLYLLGALGAAPALESASFDPYRGPQPLVVLRETDPWMMVVGSDTPTLVVYDDRTVIARGWDDDGEQVVYRRKPLDQRVFETLLGAVGTLCAGPPWKKRYDAAPGVSDMPSIQIFVRLARGAKITEIYGPHDAAAVPPELRLLVGYLEAFSLAGSVVWRPDFVEVMLWPYEYAPDASTAWPVDWPGLESARTMKCSADMYCVFLDGRLLDDLNRLAAQRKPRGAILLGGRKWAMAYRPVLPGEPVWMTALRGPLSPPP